jgi:hypothetical protein
MGKPGSFKQTATKDEWKKAFSLKASKKDE